MNYFGPCPLTKISSKLALEYNQSVTDRRLSLRADNTRGLVYKYTLHLTNTRYVVINANNRNVAEDSMLCNAHR